MILKNVTNLNIVIDLDDLQELKNIPLSQTLSVQPFSTFEIIPELLSNAKDQLNTYLQNGRVIIVTEDPFDPLIWRDATGIPNLSPLLGSLMFPGFQLIPRWFEVIDGFGDDDTWIHVTGHISSGTSISVIASGVNYTWSHAKGDLGPDNATFLLNSVIKFERNGQQLFKGEDINRVTQHTFNCVFDLENGEKIRVYS